MHHMAKFTKTPYNKCNVNECVSKHLAVSKDGCCYLPEIGDLTLEKLSHAVLDLEELIPLFTEHSADTIWPEHTHALLQHINLAESVAC